MLEFGEHLFNRVEIGAVGRQKQQPCSNRFDCSLDGLALMATQIIHDDKISLFECWQQELLDIALEACAVDGTVKDARCRDAIDTQGGKEGHCLPVAMRHKCLQALAFLAPTAKWCHIGLGPSLINEDETRSINAALVFFPPISATGDIGP